MVLVAHTAAAQRFSVTFPSERSATPLDGRLLVMISADTAGEPRLQVSDAVTTAQVFGVDVDAWRPGSAQVVDAKAFGYPIHSLADLKPGRYRVQAMINRYQTFHRSDGHTVKLPPDKWEGQAYARKPGNLYSRPVNIMVSKSSATSLVLDQEIPPVEDFAKQESKYVKYVRIKSDLLSKFWGADMYLGAWVLLPEGFDSHPDARYPLVVNHGHFPAAVDYWRETPPNADLKPDYSERFSLAGYNRIQEEYGYQFYKDWTGPGFPRVLLLQIQHATPYYDDSYAVNSENNGPYGDAIMKELVPEIERRFRGIGAGWARFTYGGSTGGWEALAAQVFYPDDFNGAFVACPDPIDFRAYCLVNIYEAVNAYYTEGDFARVEVPAARDYMGRVTSTVRQSNQLELVLGTRSRSGGQWDIWEAVYSPVGSDGYPRRIWDKETGAIDRETAAYWRDHFDLRAILERDWATLGPKLRGKIHLYCGTMDNLYLDNAVVLMEEFLDGTRDPHYDGMVDYGLRAE